MQSDIIIKMQYRVVLKRERGNKEKHVNINVYLQLFGTNFLNIFFLITLFFIDFDLDTSKLWQDKMQAHKICIYLLLEKSSEKTTV